MTIKKVLDEKVPIKIWTNDIEKEAEEQLKKLSKLPFIHSHIAVMPDVHAGKGSTIGTVIATKGAIIPAAVGVDIGCGMTAVKLPFKLSQIPGNLSDLRHSIERAIPTGRFQNKEINLRTVFYIQELGEFNGNGKSLSNERNKANLQLGSLGGGNHFIEVCGDQNGDAWIMLHSGSRNIGKVLADIHINSAKDLMKKYFINLEDQDLAYLVQGTKEYDNYVVDMYWAQNYAKYNRKEMLSRVLEQVSRFVYGEVKTESELTTFKVDCHHNYCQHEHHNGVNVLVTRKGAVSAKEGEFGIIPGSMGTKSYIVKGKGNKESFNSCSHGAGRRLSRTKARLLYNVEDLKKQTEGIECRKSNEIVDEIPSAYKSIDEVMENQTDLVDIVYELKQVLCIKGD